MSSHRRRAKEANTRIDYGLDELRRLVREALRLPCRYCGKALHEGSWSADHREPTSRGGSYSIDNLEIVCRYCNEAKGALSGEEFSDLWMVLRDWPSAARMNVLSRLRAGAVRRR